MQTRSHRMVAVSARPGRTRRMPATLAWVATAAIVVALLPMAALGVTVNGTYMCGSEVGGTLRVTYSDSVQIFGGPFRSPVGDMHWSVLAGMTITATAMPNGAEPLAWLQAVTVHTAGATFSDPQANALAAPWPDTPPGGYLVTNIFGQPIAPPGNRQVFDNDPWYGNNLIGQKVLFDQPKEGISTAVNPAICDFEFESWLVCVTSVSPPNYTVIPLMGYTWGYTFRYGADVNGNGTLGDAANEYAGNILFGGLQQGGQPSAAFKNGCARYFTINYLENNDENCALCVPEPMTGAAVLMALGSLVTYSRRRMRSRRAA